MTVTSLKSILAAATVCTFVATTHADYNLEGVNISALTVISCDESVVGNTTGRSNYGGNNAPDDFLLFDVLGQHTTVTLDACGSSYDTLLRVLDLEGNQLYVCDDCGDCPGFVTTIEIFPHNTTHHVGDLTSRGTFDTGVGVPFVNGQYILAIEGFSANHGRYNMAMRCSDSNGQPSAAPSSQPSMSPSSAAPTTTPTTANPTAVPTVSQPTTSPTYFPTSPTTSPTISAPTSQPSSRPTTEPSSSQPTSNPTSSSPTSVPTNSAPTSGPSVSPSILPTSSVPSSHPSTSLPTALPSAFPTISPSTDPCLAIRCSTDCCALNVAPVTTTRQPLSRRIRRRFAGEYNIANRQTGQVKAVEFDQHYPDANSYDSDWWIEDDTDRRRQIRDVSGSGSGSGLELRTVCLGDGPQFGSGANVFQCGWDHTRNLCRTGENTTEDELAALLESSPGDCSHHTRSPTASPSAHYQHMAVDGEIACGQIIRNDTRNSSNFGGGRSNDHFYRFHGSHGSTVELDTCGSNYDTWLRVLSEDSGNVVRQVLSCDDCQVTRCSGGDRRFTGVLTRIRLHFHNTLSEPNYTSIRANNSQGAGLDVLDLPEGDYIVQLEGFSNRAGIYNLSMVCNTSSPSMAPTAPTAAPTMLPTGSPSSLPTVYPTASPSTMASVTPLDIDFDGTAWDDLSSDEQEEFLESVVDALFNGTLNENDFDVEVLISESGFTVRFSFQSTVSLDAATVDELENKQVVVEVGGRVLASAGASTIPPASDSESDSSLSSDDEAVIIGVVLGFVALCVLFAALFMLNKRREDERAAELPKTDPDSPSATTGSPHYYPPGDGSSEPRVMDNAAYEASPAV